MAEKPDDQVSHDEKVAKAKELYARGCRNYYVKSYTEAADDLSEATKLYAEVYGVDGNELGDVYLLYAKALIAVGQDENKLIEVPENEDEDEPAEEDDGEEEADADADEGESSEKINGHTNGVEKEEEEKEEKDEPQAGPSSGDVPTASTSENENSNDVEEEANDEDGGNLEVAWEVLQNAASIFQMQEEEGLSNLLDVYNEMAGISIENGNFALALDDFKRALDTFSLLDDDKKNDRIAAEIHYKIGLCQSMEKFYDESVKSFQKAVDLLAGVIEIEKAREEQTEEIIAKIKDLEETQQEILNKITEIGEVKADEIEQVKKELSKIYGGMNGTSSTSADGAGCSSSSSASTTVKSPETDKPKPTDISHLIKRKKPDSADTVESSPAKKKAVETSPGEKVALPVVQENNEKMEEESTSVQVAAVDN